MNSGTPLAETEMSICRRNAQQSSNDFARETPLCPGAYERGAPGFPVSSSFGKNLLMAARSKGMLTAKRITALICKGVANHSFMGTIVARINDGQ